MDKYKKNLIVLLAVGVVVIVVYNKIDSSGLVSNDPLGFPPFGFHWWAAMAYWFALGVYVIRFRCSACHKPQIICGSSIYQWRWPSEVCWNCQHKIGKSKNGLS
jgi:hypothetical protein